MARINKRREVTALKQIDVTHWTSSTQQRPESPTITPPGMRLIQGT